LLKNPEGNKPSTHLIVNNYLYIIMIIKCVPYFILQTNDYTVAFQAAIQKWNKLK